MNSEADKIREVPLPQDELGFGSNPSQARFSGFVPESAAQETAENLSSFSAFGRIYPHNITYPVVPGPSLATNEGLMWPPQTISGWRQNPPMRVPAIPSSNPFFDTTHAPRLLPPPINLLPPISHMFEPHRPQTHAVLPTSLLSLLGGGPPARQPPPPALHLFTGPSYAAPPAADHAWPRLH